MWYVDALTRAAQRSAGPQYDILDEVRNDWRERQLSGMATRAPSALESISAGPRPRFHRETDPGRANIARNCRCRPAIRTYNSYARSAATELSRAYRLRLSVASIPAAATTTGSIGHASRERTAVRLLRGLVRVTGRTCAGGRSRAFISTLWPTCSLSLEVSPAIGRCTRIVVRVKLPLEPLKQPGPRSSCPCSSGSFELKFEAS